MEFTFPPLRKPSEWTEENMILVDGPKAGELIKLYEFQKEMIDVINDPNIDEVVYKMAAQVSKTTIMTAGLMYFMINDPSNIAYGMPTDSDNRKFKSGKIDPLIEAVPLFAEKFASQSGAGGKKNNTNQMQLKTGQSVFFVSMNSSAAMRGITTRRVFADEVVIAKKVDDSDPLSLIRSRAGSFPMGTYKVVMSSTPTVTNNPIDLEYDDSDKRKWFIKHKCGQEFTPEWENVKFDWTEPKIGERSLPIPETACYACLSCGEAIAPVEWKRMLRAGEWRITGIKGRKAGFYANRLMNPDIQLEKHVAEFRRCYANFDLAPFYNLVLGLSYTDNRFVDDLDALEKLRNTEITLSRIQNEVQYLVAGVDVQRDRFEITVMGVTNRSSYKVLKHFAIPAQKTTYDSKDPSWQALKNFLNGKFKREDGINLGIESKFIDSSDGNSSNVVYRFCELNSPITAKLGHFTPIKGSSSFNAPLLPTGKTDHNTKYKTKNLVMLGVSSGKLRIQEMLKHAVRSNTDGTSSVIEFTNDTPPDYFAQVTSERLQTATGKTPKWVPKSQAVRNEALDCLNYAICASVYLETVLKFPVQYFVDRNNAALKRLTPEEITAASTEAEEINVDNTAHATVSDKRPMKRRSLIRK